jgi:radical SAM superfamily enzyme YgiQ (UPF0313 family)
MRVRGLTMPLGVLYAATVLRANGFEAVVLDADHRQMEDEAILAWLREAKADVAAFSVLLGSHESAYRVARAYKQECPETLILCGGSHATHQAARIMKTYPFVDMILRGEAEESIVRLAATLAEGRSPEGIPGLCLQRPGGAAVVPEPAPFIEDLDKIPYPDRTLLGGGFYSLPIELVGRKRSVVYDPFRKSGLATVITSRGCPYQCRFCFCGMMNQGRWRTRSPANILGEIEDLYRAGYRTFFFPEDNFMVDAARVEAICDGLIGRKLKIQWATEGSVRTATPKLLRKMKAAGCEGIFFGMESACEHVLKYYGKPVTPEQSVTAAKAAQEAGIGFVVGSFIFGAPVESADDCLRTLGFITRQVAIDLPLLGILSMTPGDRIWNELREEGAIGEDAECRLWETPCAAADFRKDIPLRAIAEKCIGTAYRHFFLNPFRLGRALRKSAVNSFHRRAAAELIRCLPGILRAIV